LNILISLNHQLRIDDQPALHEALALAKSNPGSRLIFLHAEAASTSPQTPEFFSPPHPSHRIRGPHQTRIALQALSELKSKLAAAGIPLFCFWNHTEEEALGLIRKHCPVDAFFSFTASQLFSAWPIPEAQFPMTFTDFRKKLSITPDEPLPTPSLESTPNATASAPEDWIKIKTLSEFGFDLPADPRSSFPFQGDEKSARLRIESYFFNSKGLENYKTTRNGMIGTEYSSKLSPFLAIGALSVRRAWNEVLRYESIHGANAGSEWMKFELLWREFFLWSEQKYKDRFYALHGIQNRTHSYEESKDRFFKWTRAETGQPFVDANMRELNATGFISNRGRQNVASYFVHELKLPWHWGARYFEWMLIDSSMTQNYGNWAYLAGVGSDPRSFGNAPRYFNLEKQSNDYDPEGTYQKLWP
jgi:deoxyribodipyrimidine photo-lyase